MSGLEQQLLIGAVGGLVAALVTSALAVYAVKLNLDHARESDRQADQRRLRDARLARLQTSLEPALTASLAFGQVVKDTQALWSQEDLQARDARHAKMIEDALPALNQARVSLMLQPAATSLMALLDDKILPAFMSYTSARAFFAKHPTAEDRKELDGEWQKLRDGITEFRAEALRIVDSLEQPI